jgi:hypothetical protein
MINTNTDLEVLDILKSLLNYDIAVIILKHKKILEQKKYCNGCHNMKMDCKEYNSLACTYGCDYCGNCQIKVNYCVECGFLGGYRNVPSP